MNYNDPRLRDALASEYVLGTLHGPARRRFQRLLKDDPELQTAVSFWQRELTPMAAPLSGAAPPARLWEGVAARIGTGRPSEDRLNWFRRWFGGPSLASLAAGLVAGIGVMLVLPQLAPQTEPGDQPVSGLQLPPSYAGILLDGAGQPAMLISSRRHGRIVDIKVLRPIGLGLDQELTLWALSRQGAPVRLGVVPSQGKGRIELPATSEQLLAQVDELAVAAAGKGSTASQPSFILRGPCAKFW